MKEPILLIRNVFRCAVKHLMATDKLLSMCTMTLRVSKMELSVSDFSASLLYLDIV